MTRIEWDPSLETGDALVDEQHRSIHTLFNELDAADPADTHVLFDVLDRLTEHVSMHFATEEDLMAREFYPAEKADRHVAEHRKLTDGVRVKVLEFRSGMLTSLTPVVTFLREWLTMHVHESDAEMVAFVRARGATAKLPEPWASRPRQDIRSNGGNGA